MIAWTCRYAYSIHNRCLLVIVLVSACEHVVYMYIYIYVYTIYINIMPKLHGTSFRALPTPPCEDVPAKPCSGETAVIPKGSEERNVPESVVGMAASKSHSSLFDCLSNEVWSPYQEPRL